MITKLSHASIYVLDKDEAARFYTEKLGCTISQDMTMPNGYRWITLRAPEQEDLEIVLMEPEGDESLSEEQARQLRELIKAGAFGFGVFKTNDCRKTYDTYRDAGVQFVSEPKERFYGIEAIFKDNSGNWFSLTQEKA
jgi:predicted enzyme related to lactoylglutathione lyase